MIFGVLATVFGRGRAGAALAHLARKLLRIATFRYVGDFFGPCAPEAMSAPWPLWPDSCVCCWAQEQYPTESWSVATRW
eukprot:6713474-Pyramimonas_sp.AAC.1